MQLIYNDNHSCPWVCSAGLFVGSMQDTCPMAPRLCQLVVSCQVELVRLH